MVLMYEPPFAVDLPEADGQPEIQFDTLPFSIVIYTFHGRKTESDVFPGVDMRVDEHEAMVALFQPGQKDLPGLPVGVHAHGLKGRRHIEHDNIVMMPGQDAFPISFLDGPGPIIYSLMDLLFVGHDKNMGRLLYWII
jgi:hypothetical protein